MLKLLSPRDIPPISRASAAHPLTHLPQFPPFLFSSQQPCEASAGAEPALRAVDKTEKTGCAGLYQGLRRQCHYWTGSKRSPAQALKGARSTPNEAL